MPNVLITIDDGAGNALNMTGEQFADDMGIKPSLVKQIGRWI